MASVLVVDDDHDVRELLRITLNGAGIDVTTEATGAAGLLAARRLRPDLVLVDWVMQDLSGLEVCRAVRHDPSLRGTRVVLVSGRDQDGDVERALAAGAHDYVLKPFSPAALVRAVESLLATP